MSEKLQPDHVDASIGELAQLYREHRSSTGGFQKFANLVTRILGRPSASIIICGLIGVWIVGNYAAHLFGSSALEEFPFPDLEFAATVGALVVALLILTTQRHEEQLAEKRARLTLQIAVLSEKKIAKIISLLEEQRRDNPLLTSRSDKEADEMSTATDPRASLQQLEQSEQRQTA